LGGTNRGDGFEKKAEAGLDIFSGCRRITILTIQATRQRSE
jgi:hypothetical protein